MSWMDYPDNELFRLTENFTNEDWRVLRDKYYWSERLLCKTDKERKFHLLNKVREYLN